jgi:hypothetical protein
VVSLREEASCSHSQGSEINSQTQSFDAYRNSFLRVISVIIAIIKYPFKLGKMCPPPPPLFDNSFLKYLKKKIVARLPV